MTPDTIREGKPPASENLDQMGLPLATTIWLQKLLNQVATSSVAVVEIERSGVTERQIAEVVFTCQSLHSSDVQVGDLAFCIDNSFVVFLRWNDANLIITAAMHHLSFKRPYLTKPDLSKFNPLVETDLLYLDMSQYGLP